MARWLAIACFCVALCASVFSQSEDPDIKGFDEFRKKRAASKFDPDEFLRKTSPRESTSPAAFDPDAYLAKKEASQKKDASGDDFWRFMLALLAAISGWYLLAWLRDVIKASRPPVAKASPIPKRIPWRKRPENRLKLARLRFVVAMALPVLFPVWRIEGRVLERWNRATGYNYRSIDWGFLFAPPSNATGISLTVLLACWTVIVALAWALGVFRRSRR